jgi:hypothetical protein
VHSGFDKRRDFPHNPARPPRPVCYHLDPKPPRKT